TFGGFRLLLLFAPFAFFLVEFYGLIGHGRGLGEVEPKLVHLQADFVDFDELFGCEQAEPDHAAVDEGCAVVADRWNEVTPTEPGIAEERTSLQPSSESDLIAGEGGKFAGVEVKFARRFGLGPLHGGGRRSGDDERSGGAGD